MKIPKLLRGEDRLVVLERQRDRFAEELRAAVAEEGAAIAERQDLLSAVDTSDTVLKAAASRVRKARNEIATCRECADAVAAEIERLRQARAAEQNRTEREIVALATEARADRIALACTDLDNAATAFAKARERLRAVVASDGLIDGVHAAAGLFVDPAAPIVAAAVRLASPEGMPVSEAAAIMGIVQYVGASAAGEATQLIPLRNAASEIRAGTLPAKAPLSPPPALPIARIERTRLVLSEAIEWINEGGDIATSPQGEVELPVPVAEAAIAQEIGFSVEHPKAHAILEYLQKPDRLRAYGKSETVPIARKGPPYRRVGVNLLQWLINERARLMRARAAA